MRQLGSRRPKFWIEHPETRERWLFKFRQHPGDGDDWAEKASAEIAELLGVPHATVELATHGGEPGPISLDLTLGGGRGDLVLGNDLLVEADPAYPRHGRRVAEHTLDRVFRTLEEESILLPESTRRVPDLQTAADVFVGFLLLDALVANQDRHHQNWGILDRRTRDGGRERELAASFDHASTLGRNLTDEERQDRLRTRDAGYTVEAFVRRTKSALFASTGGQKPLTLLEAFAEADRRCPRAGAYWRSRLSGLDESVLDGALDRLPLERCGPIALSFVKRMLECNRRNLLALPRP